MFDMATIDEVYEFIDTHYDNTFYSYLAGKIAEDGGFITFRESFEQYGIDLNRYNKAEFNIRYPDTTYNSTSPYAVNKERLELYISVDYVQVIALYGEAAETFLDQWLNR